MAHLENCSRFKYLAVDTEGFTAETKLGISVAHPAMESMYFPVGHMENVNIDEETHAYLDHVLEMVPYRIFHNASHDLTILPNLYNLSFVCTMIMGHMVNENVMSNSLDYRHKFHCGGEGKEIDPLMASIIKTAGWEYVPFELMNKYGRVDALITMELFLKLLPMYEEQFGPLWSPS
jgi:DNA polymerase I-like protein with 3'-5' exonuclease and polymerase domains